MGKTLIITLPLLVLHGYLLAIIYQQWWLKQFGIPSDFVYLNSNTLLIAAIALLIMISILTLCYYALTPLLNRKDIFRKKADSNNSTHAGIVALSLMIYCAYGVVSYFNFHGSVQLFSFAFIAGVAGIMIFITGLISSWGQYSRNHKNRWYAKPYIYLETHLMGPIIASLVLFFIGSYLIAGQLSIMNWQAYAKDPNYVLVDGKDEYVLIGVFGDKVGVTLISDFGVEVSATRFVDIEKVTIEYDQN